MANHIKQKGVYIPSIDGKDAYISNHYISPEPEGYVLKRSSKEYNINKFKSVLDNSLDLFKLRDVYYKAYKNNRFSFFYNKKEYSTSVINLTFDYSVKEFNKVNGNCYVKNGYNYNNLVFTDNVCMLNNELIAIQVDEPTESFVPSEILSPYFYIEGNTYKTKENFKTLISTEQIRSLLYKEGFVCDGIRYIRFKRSSGSARVGKCLFIDEKLYNRMHLWEKCGLSVRKGQKIDLAAWEAYISLTLSSIIGTITINPENILVIDDYESVFEENSIATYAKDNSLVTTPEKVQIKNSIWDGQSLIDISLMGEYDSKGMLLLRNRFFKSCAFSANIQKWFLDNNITEISQLKGYTLAKSIEDVKFITTPSSIKFMKFGPLKDWLDRIDSSFGVVKYEKKTHFFDGKLVQTHYQLLNTLQLSLSEVEEFLKPTLDYMNLLNSDPAVMRYHLKFPEDISTSCQRLQNNNDVVYRMLGVNDKFTNTSLYQKFKQNLLSSFRSNTKLGHVLVHGNYSTLLGNPIEMLQAAIGTFTGESHLGTGNIYCKNFSDRVKLLGSRSPHVVASCILVAENKYDDTIDRYVNLTNEIVVVNSINENLLNILSGAD